MNILGLSFGYHDAAAALVCDGRVVVAIQEERLSRRKHDAEFPKRAIQACLNRAGLQARDIDHVAYYELPLLKFDRIIAGCFGAGWRGRPILAQALQDWFRRQKFWPQRQIANLLDIPIERVHIVRHHLAHAASAFLSSPFERAAVITVDGVGEHETATLAVGNGTSIRTLTRQCYPHSIGLLYSAFTAHLGFEVNEGEYKVMGMAGFGKPRYRDAVAGLVRFGGGAFRIDQKAFDFLAPSERFTTDRFEDLFGAPRAPESPFRLVASGSAAEGSVEARSQHCADLAASVQSVVESMVLDLVDNAQKRTGVRHLAMAGGVALNSAVNGRLVRERDVDLYIQPAAGNSGGALGAALWIHARKSGGRPHPLDDAFLGLEYDEEEALAALKAQRITNVERCANPAERNERVAERLAAGDVVGWMQGRFEWGPRALGARSILADPSLPDMQDRINEKIKFREAFRPFAPAVLGERAHEFFLLPGANSSHRPENFMLAVAPVRAEARGRIPAVCHVDGTSRVQLVPQSPTHPLRGLLEAFERRTGLPILLNTSFNRRGEPIVATPADALQTFLWSGLDTLVMGNLIVNKDIVI